MNSYNASVLSSIGLSLLNHMTRESRQHSQSRGYHGSSHGACKRHVNRSARQGNSASRHKSRWWIGRIKSAVWGLERLVASSTRMGSTTAPGTPAQLRHQPANSRGDDGLHGSVGPTVEEHRQLFGFSHRRMAFHTSHNFEPPKACVSSRQVRYKGKGKRAVKQTVKPTAWKKSCICL